MSDLSFIRPFLDALDIVDSQYANDLQEIQDAVIKASGTDQKPNEISYNMKVFKVVVVDDDKGDVNYMTVELPFESKSRWMKETEESIAIQGMSINPKTDQFGNNASGVALNWMYLPLDLKASMLEEKFKVALYDFAWFVNRANELIDGDVRAMDESEIQGFEWTFNKSMIANEEGKIDRANESVGKVSEKTRLENDPRVKDVEKEIQRMDAEREKLAPAASDSLGKIPLAIQQLALAQQRAFDTDQPDKAARLGAKIDSLLDQIKVNGAV